MHVLQVGVVKIYFNTPIFAEQRGEQKKVKRQSLKKVIISGESQKITRSLPLIQYTH